jgi:hypothetical protein
MKTNKQTNKQTLDLKRKVYVLFIGLVLCVLQSCSTEEFLLENESSNNKRDYSYEVITFQDLKKINNNAFIEAANLKAVVALNKTTDKQISTNYDIDLQSIRYIKKTNNDETFSFRILQVPTATFQQNIVVKCKKNEKPQSYLITYYLNKQVNQINNSDDFIKAIKSTSITKIGNQFKSSRTTSGDCYDIGYYDEVLKCEGELVTPENNPRCFDSNNQPKKIYIFKVITSACSGGGGNDFTPLASQWNQYNTAPSDPYSGYTGSPAGGGVTSESTGSNIFAPNYYENGDLSDPAVQNMLQINRFIATLYNSSNEIKGVIDNTEWLLAYTNYWIGTNGGLSTQNQFALTYAFNNIPVVFNQYNDTTYDLNAIANFKFSAFQFLLFHGEFLSKLDLVTQTSILNEITSLEKIELINNIVNLMIENPDISWEQIENWFMETSEGQDGNYDAAYWENPNLTFPQQNLPTYNNYVNNMARFANGKLMEGADNVYNLVGGKVLQARIDNPRVTDNTCALKVSIALVRTNIIIPDLPGITLEGSGDFAGKFFFLNAK